MLDHISYSFLHLLACPYAAWLRYSAAVTGPTTPWLALGNALHYGIEYGHYVANAGPETILGEYDFNTAVRYFKNEFSRIIEEDQVSIGWPQLKKMEAEGIEMLGKYNEQILSGELSPKPLALEKEFELPFMGTKIVGRIDKVEYDEGYIVTDFKSGKNEPDPWFLDHNLQFTAYAWACKELYGELPKIMYWHHLRNGKLIPTTRTDADIDDLKTMVSNALKMSDMGIRHRIFHENVCGMCDYRGPTCDDKDLEARTLLQLENGERPEPSIAYKSRSW